MIDRTKVQIALQKIRESPDIPEEQKGFVAEDYMRNNFPDAWQKIQANMQGRQSPQGGGQPPGLLNMVPTNTGGSPPITDLIGNDRQDYNNKLAAAQMNPQNPLQKPDVIMPIDPDVIRSRLADMRRIGRDDERAKQAALLKNQNGTQKPVEQQGIFSRLGSGLKSAGRGMGQYTEKLFNDPNRMAMLQGGLSMMNPNSYYDKEGFGSVFQGLEAGLGNAQKGMEGVIARKKAIADIAETDAEAQWKKAGGTNKLPASYLQVLDRWKNAKDPVTKGLLFDRLQVLGKSPEYAGEHQLAISKNKELGTGIGGASVGLQTAEDSYAYMTDVVSRLMNHPGMKGVVGIPSVAGLVHAPGTPEADFRALQKQVEGGVFLRAFQDLKGGGHITEIEGEQAKESLARMATAQTEIGFKKAMNEYLAILDKGIKAHRKTAKGDLSGTPSKFKARQDNKDDYNPLGLPAEKL